MVIDKRYHAKHASLLRDSRPLYVKLADWYSNPSNAFVVCVMGAVSIHVYPAWLGWADLILFIFGLYFLWLATRERTMPFRMPASSKYKDPKSKDGKPDGILFIGNNDPGGEEMWFSNSDARTHILYLGTTGSGKTEGLKSFASNALSWASGFVYVDGKADTDLWSSLSSMVRRFGRDDDLLVLNYMTGNSDRKAPSNTMNPFSSGSASYLTNMLVSLMPEAEGDNAMWKERAVSLIGALMPAMTYKRDTLDMPLSVSTIRQNLTLSSVVRLSRDEMLPERLRTALKGYLETLPGYNDAAFDDEGRDKPMGPDQPMIDTTTAKTQHGYLSMQFTRSLQSLGDDYGYIFDAQAADVDMVDVVLNRRILVVLIPALEKSGDETANLGKIVAATIKGMMGSTLGSTVEGESATVIENKPTHSSTPFMTIFDEVGYYTAQGMAVMAAQARSLGFCLIYAAQDLPALEKRVKEEARSIAANCNIKIFGKLEDPTQTKEFFEKTVGSIFVTEVSGFSTEAGSLSHTYYDNYQAGVQLRGRSNYDAVRAMKEGQAVIAFSEEVLDARMYYSNPGHAKAMRVTRFVALPPPDEALLKHTASITKLRDLMVKKGWQAQKADVAVKTSDEIKALVDARELGAKIRKPPQDQAIFSVASIHALQNPIRPDDPALPATAPASAPTTRAAPQLPTTPPPATAAPAKQDENPMGFFSGSTPPPAKEEKKTELVSWENLIEKSEEAKAPAAVKPLEAIPNDVADVIKDAAENVRKKLFQATE